MFNAIYSIYVCNVSRKRNIRKKQQNDIKTQIRFHGTRQGCEYRWKDAADGLSFQLVEEKVTRKKAVTQVYMKVCIPALHLATCLGRDCMLNMLLYRWPVDASSGAALRTCAVDATKWRLRWCGGDRPITQHQLNANGSSGN